MTNNASNVEPVKSMSGYFQLNGKHMQIIIEEVNTEVNNGKLFLTKQVLHEQAGS